MSVSRQLQLGRLFREVKFVIFITFESRDKTCSKIEKTWFQLVYWVAKNSLVNEKKSRSSRPEVFYQKGFLKNSQNSQENTCTGVFFISVADLSCFRVNSAKFLRAPILQNKSERLLYKTVLII